MRKGPEPIKLDINHIIKEYREGKSAENIAKALGVSKRTILSRLKDAGIQRRQARTFPEITKEFLVDRYIDQKMSTRDIAEIFNCAPNVINKRLRKFHIPIRKGSGDTSFTKEERRSMHGRPRETHNLWRGGVTGVSVALRGVTEAWRIAELQRSEYTCGISGKQGGTLHVHHITPFHVIRDRAFAETGIKVRPKILDYEEREMTALKDKIIELHAYEIGYVMTSDLHWKFHSLYGINTTETDLDEFKTRYRLGEFDELEAIA